MHLSRRTVLSRFAGIALLLLPAAGLAQDTSQPDVWAPFRVLTGTWTGTTNGQPGSGSVELRIQLVLRDRYLQITNHSVYPPQEKNPKGEVHEDIGMISLDKVRKAYVYRQFNAEGFVNQYTMDAASAGEKVFVFISESIENIPPGWRARETYQIVSGDELNGRFELAEPGKEFEIYSASRLKRKK